MTIMYYIRLHKRLDLNDTTMYFSCSKKLSEFLLISVMFTEAGLIQGTFFKENTYAFTYLD